MKLLIVLAAVLATVFSGKTPSVLQVLDASCVAKCEGVPKKSFPALYKLCDDVMSCWISKVGISKNITCHSECWKNANEFMKFVTSVNSSKELRKTKVVEGEDWECVAECLGESYEEIMKIVEECADFPPCWLAVIGVPAIACLISCA